MIVRRFGRTTSMSTSLPLRYSARFYAPPKRLLTTSSFRSDNNNRRPYPSGDHNSKNRHRSFYAESAPSMVYALVIASITYFALELVQNFLDGHFQVKELQLQVDALQKKLEEVKEAEREEKGKGSSVDGSSWWNFWSR